MSTLTVPCEHHVTMRAEASLHHLCPFRDEVDTGTVTVTWRTAGATLELHALAGYLTDWATAKVTHEQITDLIARDLASLAGVELVNVETRWETAGAGVLCSTTPTLVG